MEADKFVACAQRLHALQAIYITFKLGSDGIAGLRRLLALTRSNPAVRIQQCQMTSVLGVITSDEWQGVSRTIMVYGIMHAHEDLLTPMARDIENISTGNHIANNIFTSNPKKQREAVAEIVTKVLDDSIIKEVDSWGARITGKLHIPLTGLPLVEFVMTKADDDDIVARLEIDGFSGRAIINGDWQDFRFSPGEYQGVRQRIYSVLTDALDKLTAA